MRMGWFGELSSAHDMAIATMNTLKLLVRDLYKKGHISERGPNL